MKVQDPVLPTQAEIDEHMTTHLPYRSWCRFCIRGCGKVADHRQQDKVEHVVPEFHMDYAFMGTEEVKGSMDKRAATILGVKERDRRMHMSTIVPKKGGSIEFVAKRVVAFIDEMGLSASKIILKSDQEPAIKDLINMIKKLRAGIETFTEHSLVGASKSNGIIERGIQTMEGMIRMLKDALEFRWKTKIDEESPILSWLVEFASV